MADYRNSFRAGLDAYNDAERARQEVSEVFEEFARDVRDGSGGHIGIQRGRARLVLGRHVLITPMVAMQRGFDPSARQDEESLVLAATGHNGQDVEILCEYSLGERGYPVKLIYGRRNVTCHDRESLEKGLQDLLEHPETGGKLRRLMPDDRTSENDASPSP
jgi:hypothetical protein